MRRMNMKLKSFVSGIVCISASALMAASNVPFAGWDELIDSSPDILIVRAGATDKGVGVRGLFNAAVESLVVLKGSARLGQERFESACLLKPSEEYLVFCSWRTNGICYATESYRVVPLGPDFETGVLTGKSLGDQLKLLIQRRLSAVTSEIDALRTRLENDSRERERLEQALAKK